MEIVLKGDAQSGVYNKIPFIELILILLQKHEGCPSGGAVYRKRLSVLKQTGSVRSTLIVEKHDISSKKLRRSGLLITPFEQISFILKRSLSVMFCLNI